MLSQIPKLKFHSEEKPFVLAGPCLIESEDMAMRIGESLASMSDRLGFPLIFKGSYRKANRTRLDSYTGIGDLKALEILQKVGKAFDLPTVTDVHLPAETHIAARYVDVLQIPAFLCRQTDLLLAASQTGKVVNIKKGQFMSADAMQFAVEKAKSINQAPVFLTDRGNSFGYGDLIFDMRNIPTLRKYSDGAIADCTHSLQQPNRGSGVTGGTPELIATISRSAVAAGCDGLFFETHHDPATAKSDGANMLKLSALEELLKELIEIYQVTKARS